MFPYLGHAGIAAGDSLHGAANLEKSSSLYRARTKFSSVSPPASYVVSSNVTWAQLSFSLANTRWINNWDLVDTSAPHILGVWLFQRDRRVLKRLAASSSLWEQRIAVLATQTFIREGDFTDTLQLCETLLGHPRDLMHKACGWMLREIGKRELSVLRTFLDAHAPRMPRTMLRYAIEKLSEKERRHYLSSN